MRTIDIPGGTADIIDAPEEWTPRRRRPIELLASRMGQVMEQVRTAARILCDGDLIDDRSGQKDADGDPAFPGADINLTERQLELLSRLNDATTWAMLHSWTLPIPLPSSPEDMLDSTPPDVYDSLRLETAKIAVGDGGFTPDAVGDTESPTGASED
jgi:hypothetical protein